MQHGTADHRIILGDALSILPEIPDESVDLVFADPPYNIGKKFGDFFDSWPSEEAYIEWCQKWLVECFRVLKPSGSIYIMASTQAMPYIDIFVRKKIEILSRIVWSYDSSGVQARKYFGSMYEPIIFAVKDRKKYKFRSEDILVEARTGAVRKLIDYRGDTPKPYNTRKVPGNVWDIARVRYRMEEYEEHPSQKPEALLERIIRASSDPGDIVMDPFGGTFTTSAVAKRLERKSISIERNAEYFKIGLRRVLGKIELEGVSLSPVKKNSAKRNFGGKKQNGTPVEGELFDAGN